MKKIIAIFLLIFVFLTFGCVRQNQRSAAEGDISVLVFITGIIAGSPTYEMMTEGALEFARENPNVRIRIYEAGMNQGQWEQQLMEMVAGGEYDVVIGSNPSLPDICVNIADLFPDLKFIILDALYEGHPRIRTYLYNQYEQALILGYLAGLITTSDMPHANSLKRIGFIAAQEFPLLTRHMIPGFIEGAKKVDNDIELDFRVIGSWADANRAAELASAMLNAGVDVFTSIAGGAAQGMIKTASERGAYMLWFNTNSYNLAPGFIVGCGMLEQKRLTIEVLNDIAGGRVEYGRADILGVRDGYISFVLDDPGYLDNIPADIRQKFEAFLDEFRD